MVTLHAPNTLPALSCSTGPGTSAPTAPPPEPAAPSVEQLWTDFCHYVVIASPDLAAAYGRRVAAEASPDQLRLLLAAQDETTRRAVRLLDETELTANHPDLGAAWRQIRKRADRGVTEQ
ncbi:MAG: hypothetical protein ACYSUA_12555 [Planctomycetota bacterium]|jgi:hypothetical protein